MVDEKNGKHLARFGVLITLLGAGIRIYNVGGDSLWFDELLTRLTANAGWVAALDLRDHPPLLYWLVTASIRTFGESEWSLRLPSLLAGIAAVPLMVMLGRVTKRPFTGIWAALLLALSPFHLRYAHEARHYALLMCFSLAATLFLYVAMRRRQLGWWFGFAAATALNLYTHYGALMVLAAHLVTLIGWLVIHLGQRKPMRVGQPVMAGLLLLVLYAPWLPNLLEALGSNLGETAVASTGITPLAQWLRNAYVAFGFNSPQLAVAMLVLVIIGFIAWGRQAQWLIAALSLSLVVVPFLLITTMQVARWSFPKYVIYMLPAYLLAAGAGVDFLLALVKRHWPTLFPTVAIGVVGMLLVAAAPPLQAEYRYVERDWRGAVDALATVAEDGDVFVVINLDLPDGFNQGGITAPFYLDQAFSSYTILDGNRLDPERLRSLPEEAGVWFLALDRHAPFPAADGETAVQRFAGSLFLVSQQSPAASTLAQMQGLLHMLQPITTAPSPQCLLQQGAAALHFAQDDVAQADAALISAQNSCPTPPTDPGLWRDLALHIQYARMDAYVQGGEQAKAVEIAHAIWLQNPKDSQALRVLTVENLLTAFTDGRAEILLNGAPEPPAQRSFLMPTTGEVADVIFLHPPAAVSYALTLPDAPTHLQFRLAMDPQSWGWGGDGSTFVVLVQSGEAAAVELFRKHIDNMPENQRWHDENVSLAVYAGQQITLTLVTESGPTGDSTGDWAGWETPRLMWQP